MYMYLVETTHKGQLCGINARNCKAYVNLPEAKMQAKMLAVANGAANMDAVAFDDFLDGTIKVYDHTEGKPEDVPALAYITRIDIGNYAPANEKLTTATLCEVTYYYCHCPHCEHLCSSDPTVGAAGYEDDDLAYGNAVCCKNCNKFFKVDTA